MRGVAGTDVVPRCRTTEYKGAWMPGDEILMQITAALLAVTPTRRRVLLLTVLSFIVLC